MKNQQGVYFLVGYLLVGQNNMNFIDLFIKNYFSLVRTAGLTETMYILSNIFDVTIYSSIIFICFIILIYLLRGKRYAELFAITILSTGVVVYLLKLFFNVTRPDGGVVSAFGQSFPSYHASISTVFFILFIYIFKPLLDFKNRSITLFSRFLLQLVCLSMIFVVSFSRVYLGVHWLSDVLGGVILGLIIVYSSIMFFKTRRFL